MTILKPTFAFLDESGNLSHKSPQKYFAVGAVIDSYPDELIEKLHSCLEALISVLKKENDPRIEFKFSLIKTSSLPVYLKIIDLLESFDSWRFCCLVIDKNDSKFIKPKNPQEMWEAYLRFTKLLLQKNLYSNEKTVLLADFYKKPAGKVHTLATLPSVVPQLNDTLQVESQGILMVQVADILMGASLYEGKDKVKLQLCKRIKKLKKKLPKWRFNKWEMKWR